MKEQWKPLNAIGSNDYPIWLGQEENGNFRKMIEDIDRPKLGKI